MTKLDLDSLVGRRLKLRDLHVFFTVVQTGSLAKAASHLRVSQPAVSQTIRDLELSLGVKLFDRNSRGVEPTTYGRTLLARGQTAFDELKQGIREIQFLSEPTSGVIRFGCPEAIAVILPPVIESFSKRYPAVVIEAQDEEFDRLATKLRDRQMDFVIQKLRGRPAKDDPFFDDLDAEILSEDELVIVAGAQSEWARRRKLDLSDLLDTSWILTAPGSWNYRVVADVCEARGLPMPKVVLQTFSTHLRVNMVATGHYIATFPKSVADYYAERFGLKILRVGLPHRPWPTAVLTLKGRTVSPVAHLFIDHVRAAFAPHGVRTVPRKP